MKIEDGFKRAVNDHWPEVVYEDILDAEEVGTEMGCLGPLNTRGAWDGVSSSHWEILTGE